MKSPRAPSSGPVEPAVRLENDGNAAALGEWHFGAGRGAASLVFVTVSTGIGGEVISDGRIVHGRRGLTGEIGHMTITNESERCHCGGLLRGCGVGHGMRRLGVANAVPRRRGHGSTRCRGGMRR
ncbi:ROK family protein [Rhizobium sp. 814_E9_N1_1]|uniref:ROK family protein n=1 Tax=unclassified Rhizobium TaxID=2613769 RepID=UPI003F2478DC